MILDERTGQQQEGKVIFLKRSGAWTFQEDLLKREMGLEIDETPSRPAD